MTRVNKYLLMAYVGTLFPVALAAPASAQTFTAIDCPGYAYTHAFGINDFGAIVGDCELLDGKISGYVRHRGNWTIFDGPDALTTSHCTLTTAAQSWATTSGPMTAITVSCTWMET